MPTSAAFSVFRSAHLVRLILLFPLTRHSDILADRPRRTEILHPNAAS